MKCNRVSGWARKDHSAVVFQVVTHMTAMGISLIAIGLALVCVGIAFWPGASPADPPIPDSPDEFRTILNALDEEDHREENPQINGQQSR